MVEVASTTEIRAAGVPAVSVHGRIGTFPDLASSIVGSWTSTTTNILDGYPPVSRKTQAGLLLFADSAVYPRRTMVETEAAGRGG